MRLALRRDRIVLPIWSLVIAVVPAMTAGTYEQLYPTAAQRAALNASMGDNPSIALLYGPAFDLSTAGGFTAWRYGTVLPLVFALVCVFTMTRHTRQEEDTGRQELLSSAIVGRYAPLTASVLVCAGCGLVTGLVAAAAMIGSGMAASGSLAFGLALTGVAWVFTGVAAVAAQLATHSRTANGIAGAALGLTFALRGIGDSVASASWLSWLSPIGWSTQVRPFAGDRFWLLILPLLVAAGLAALAYALQARRDLGHGILPPRPGPAAGSPRLRTPLALAWRLHRAALIGWMVGFAVLCAMFGSLASAIGDLVAGSGQAREMFERMGGSAAVVDAFLAATASIVAMAAALHAVQATLRMRSEEAGVRVEPLLATRVTRLRWLSGHLVFVLGGPATLLLTAGVSMGLLHGLRVGDVGGELPRVLGGCLAQLPAVWVVAGLAVMLFGAAPRLATGAWAVATLFLLISMFGPVLDVGQTVLDFSPFQHVPKLPGSAFTATPLAWLTGIATLLVVIGGSAFRRRDLS
jgi:ABC-2 type transport system permease protein